MKNKGYTLLELLGVIAILAVLVILVFPSVINFIKKGNDKIDSITHDLIISAASDYAKDNSSELYILDGGTHCVSIETLIGKQYLDESLIEKDLYTSKSVKITNIDKFKYEITDTDTCMVLAPGLYDEHDRLLFSWDELVEEYDFKNLIETDVVWGGDPIYPGKVIDSIEGASKLIIDESVTKIGNEAFVGSINLKEVIIEGKTEIGDDAFHGSSNLKKITMNEVTSIGERAFWGTSLENVTIPKSVTSIGEAAFLNCQKLETVTIEANITSIESHTFVDCINLKTVNIPNSVTNIGPNAFSGTAITSITIPDSVTTIDSVAFGGCSNIESVTIGKGLNNLAIEAFQGSNNLSSIVVDPDNSKYDSRDNCNAIIETATNTLVVGGKNTVIPGTVTTIGARAFMGNTSLTKITIPGSVKNIDSLAFANTGLTEITISDSVTNINGAFEGCESLTTIYYKGTAPYAPWGAPNATIISN